MNMNALLITQYERFGTVGRDEYLENYMHEMDVDIDMLSAFNEFLANNDESIIYAMSELEQELSTLNPVEAFSKAIASESQFSWNDDYFSYDGYNNIESYSENQVVKLMRSNKDFLKWYIDENNFIDWNEAQEDIKEANELIKQGY